MTKTTIKQMLRKAGFEGSIHFRKASEFMQVEPGPDKYGPAIHCHWFDAQYDLGNIMHSVGRDGFETVVIYLEPKSYYMYRALVETPKHVWTEGEINGLRKGLGYCTSWSKAAREDFVQDLMRMTFKFNITKEQSKFGIEWLRRTQFNLQGRLRAAKSTFIGDFEAKVIRNFKRFEFVGLCFEGYNQYSECYQQISPIYRTISKSGEYFEYRCSPMGGFGCKYEVTDTGKVGAE